MKITSMKLLGTALASAFLASCGGESSNLPEPARPIVSTCTSDTCISGIFVADGVVEGLNYECGNIRSKTSFQGEFSCPLDAASSKITFLISHPETGNKVTLGEYTFRPVYTSITTYDEAGTPSTTSSYEAVPKLTTDKRVYLTPRELISEQFSSGFSDRALKITALLHSLDTNFTVGAAVSPANIINLSEANKLIFLKGMLAAEDDKPRIVVSSDADFTSIVNPGLAAVGAGREISSDLQDYLPIAQQATHAISAGIYRSNEPALLYTGFPSFSGLDDPTITLDSIVRLPFAAKNTSNTFYGYMNFGVDRSGRLFGFGATEMRRAGTLLTDPLALSPSLLQTWPNSGNLKDITLNIHNSDATLRPETIVMLQGVVDQGSMANDPGVYKDYFGTETSVDTRLGRWEMKSGGSVVMGGGDFLAPRMELRHRLNAFPILDPDVWNGISFPIHLKAKITESCETAPCIVSEYVNITVLADGNIISDRDGNCKAVDSALKDTVSAAQELPVGVVTRAFTNDGAGATGGSYLIPLIMLPSELLPAGTTRQIEIGTTAPARLRVDAASSKFGEIYSNASAAVDDELSWIDVYMINKSGTDDYKWRGTVTTSKRTDCPA